MVKYLVCLPAAVQSSPVHVAGERSRHPPPLPQAQTRRLFRQNQEQTPQPLTEIKVKVNRTKLEVTPLLKNRKTSLKARNQKSRTSDAS